MEEKEVYILLTDTGSLLTKLIKFYTKKPYNHASISFNFDLSEVYSFGRKKMNNPFLGGFVKENVKHGIFKEAKCEIYSFTVTVEEIQEMRGFIKKLEEQKELYGYNFLGLLGFIMNKPIIRKKAFFCSEFVASVLMECESFKFEKPTSLIAPCDLQNVANSQLVYRGMLKDYYNKGGVNEQDISANPFPVVV